MAEYIEREALMLQLAGVKIHLRGDSEWISGYRDALQAIGETVQKRPAADVAPVVHGWWVDRSDRGSICMTHPYVCNRCGRVEMLKEPYCNCGAKMDLEVSNNVC